MYFVNLHNSIMTDGDKLRALIWDDPELEDFTEEIRFDIKRAGEE